MSQKRILIENVASLYVLQGANYIIPLVAFPYLVRVLGADNFGLMAYAFSVVQYFILITDYGFNLTATRDISVNRDNDEEISKIFSSVFIIKTVLILACIFVYFSLVYVIPQFKLHRWVFIYTFLAVLGNYLYPIWFFQGFEKLKYTAVISLVARLLTTPLIFILIKKRTDINLATFIQNSPVVVSGIIALFITLVIYRIKIINPGRIYLIKTVKSGWPVFISMMSVNVFANAPVLVLGAFAEMVIVGYYSIAFKIIQILINLHMPIANTIFPRVSSMFIRSRLEAVMFLKNVLKYAGSFFSLVSIITFLLANQIVRVIAGQYNDDIAILVRIMSIMPAAVFIDNLLGVQTLLNIEKQKEYMKALVLGGISSVIMLFILVPKFKAVGTAISFVSAEFVMLLMLYYFVKREKTINIIGV